MRDGSDGSARAREAFRAGQRAATRFYSAMCPAAVYEAGSEGRLAISGPNCIDCKATDVLGLVEGLPNFFLVKNSSLFMGDLISTETAGVSEKVPLPKLEPEAEPESEADAG